LADKTDCNDASAAVHPGAAKFATALMTTATELLTRAAIPARWLLMQALMSRPFTALPEFKPSAAQ